MTSEERRESYHLDSVLDDVIAERQAQNLKFGPQNHPDGTGQLLDRAAANAARNVTDAKFKAGEGTWRHILIEEVAEALAETNIDELRCELVQVAAVAVAWIQALDRRPRLKASATQEEPAA